MRGSHSALSTLAPCRSAPQRLSPTRPTPDDTSYPIYNPLSHIDHRQLARWSVAGSYSSGVLDLHTIRTLQRGESLLHLEYGETPESERTREEVTFCRLFLLFFFFFGSLRYVLLVGRYGWLRKSWMETLGKSIAISSSSCRGSLRDDQQSHQQPRIEPIYMSLCVLSQGFPITMYLASGVNIHLPQRTCPHRPYPPYP